MADLELELPEIDLNLTEDDLKCPDCTSLQQENRDLKAEIKALEGKNTATAKVVQLCQKLKEDLKTKHAAVKKTEQDLKRSQTLAQENAASLLKYQEELKTLKGVEKREQTANESILKLRKHLNDLKGELARAKAQGAGDDGTDSLKKELQAAQKETAEMKERLRLAQQRIKVLMAEKHSQDTKMAIVDKQNEEYAYKVDQLEHQLKQNKPVTGEIAIQTDPLPEPSPQPSPQPLPQPERIPSQSQNHLYASVTRLESQLKEQTSANAQLKDQLKTLEAQLKQARTAAPSQAQSDSITLGLEVNTHKRTIAKLKGHVEQLEQREEAAKTKADASMEQVEQLEARVKRLQHLLEQAGVDPFDIVTGKVKPAAKRSKPVLSLSSDVTLRSSPARVVPDVDLDAMSITSTSTSSSLSPNAVFPADMDTAIELANGKSMAEPSSRVRTEEAIEPFRKQAKLATNTTTQGQSIPTPASTTTANTPNTNASAKTSTATNTRRRTGPSKAKRASTKLAKLCNSAAAQRFLTPATIQRPAPVAASNKDASSPALSNVATTATSTTTSSTTTATTVSAARTSRVVKEHVGGRSPPKNNQRRTEPTVKSAKRPATLTTALRKTSGGSHPLTQVEWGQLVKTEIASLLTKRRSPEQTVKVLQQHQPLTGAMLMVVVSRVLETQAGPSKVLRVQDQREDKLARLLASLSTDADLHQNITQHLIDTSLISKQANSWNHAPCRCLRLLASKHLRDKAHNITALILDLLRLHNYDSACSVVIASSVLHVWPDFLSDLVSSSTAHPLRAALVFNLATSLLDSQTDTKTFIAQVSVKCKTKVQACLDKIDPISLATELIRQCSETSTTIALVEVCVALHLLCAAQPFRWIYEHVLVDDLWAAMDQHIQANASTEAVQHLASVAAHGAACGVANPVMTEQTAVEFLLGLLVELKQTQPGVATSLRKWFASIARPNVEQTWFVLYDQLIGE
eukprot:TRINITY_DN8195_c0_g2_i1.p1 TRINITY_DN8195_c0_g2~~TRINITY_DN8195_c0_g2_i1.p1  ORF type:complete len:972 (+),score=242.54 TRINITY_DN8195_c0_g2_i1:115-3030(+)